MTRYTHEFSASLDRRDFIHLVGLGAMGALVLGLDVPVVAQKQPNFIFMLSDDQGWDGLSVQMHDAISGSKSDFYQTPNIRETRASGHALFGCLFAFARLFTNAMQPANGQESGSEPLDKGSPYQDRRRWL